MRSQANILSATRSSAEAGPNAITAVTGVTGVAVAIRWAISPGALLIAEPARALLNGHAATLTGAELVITLDGQGRASAELHVMMRGGASDRIPIELSVNQASIVEDGRMTHADVPGVLRSSFVRGDAGDDGAMTIVYARSELLQSVLGLSGGVYEQPELVGEAKQTA